MHLAAVAAETSESFEPFERPHLRLIQGGLADLESEPEAPEVIVVPEQQQEPLARHEAERLFRTAAALGKVALAETINMFHNQYPTLLHAVKAAARGDKVARKMVETNAGTDVVERTVKAGVVMEVGLEVDDRGNVKQFNQTMEQVLVNGLHFASGNGPMRGRAEAETRNGMRMGINLRMDKLEDHCFVVISRPDDTMTKEQLQECGFFTDTMSTAIQVIRIRDGQLIQESAFVAGVTAPDSERQDAGAVVHLGRQLGVDFEGMSSTDILDTPLLIPQAMMPNGVVDLVKLYDEYDGTFFGQDKPAQDYVQYLEFCRQREAGMQPTVQKIVDELLSEADALRTPTDATLRLHKLSEKHMVEYAVADETIDPRVFGGVAAEHIVNARYYRSRGEEEMFIRSLEQAQETAVSSSCPWISNDGEATGTPGSSVNSEPAQAGGDSKAESRKWKTKKGRCVVKTCPTRRQPAQVDVGPCGVCMDRCQEMFNAGIDPTASLIVVESRPRQELTVEPLDFSVEGGAILRFLNGIGYANQENEDALAAQTVPEWHDERVAA